MGSFEISRTDIYPKYLQETVLVSCLYYKAKKFRTLLNCKYFKFGSNTTGLTQSHFRNLSACVIKVVILSGKAFAAVFIPLETLPFSLLPRTPLHCAAANNATEMSRFLVEHGACVLAATSLESKTPGQCCERSEPSYFNCTRYLTGKKRVNRIWGGFDWALKAIPLSFLIGFKISRHILNQSGGKKTLL